MNEAGRGGLGGAATWEMPLEDLLREGRSQECVHRVPFLGSALRSPWVLPNTYLFLYFKAARGEGIIFTGPILALCSCSSNQVEDRVLFFQRGFFFLIEKNIKKKTFREEVWENIGKVSFRKKLSLYVTLCVLLIVCFNWKLSFVGFWKACSKVLLRGFELLFLWLIWFENFVYLFRNWG